MKYDHFEAAHFYGDPQPSGPRDTFFIPLVKKFNKNKKLKTPVENVAFSRTFFYHLGIHEHVSKVVGHVWQRRPGFCYGARRPIDLSTLVAFLQ